MTITAFLAIFVAVALGVAFAPYVRPLLKFLLAFACLLVAFGGFLIAVALVVIAFVWPDAVRGFGYWYYAPIGVLLAMSLGAFKAKEWYSRRCPVCKEKLFVGDADPLDYYLAGRGGWGGIPLTVRLGSWRKVWRRQWYHQTCCGVYVDAVNRDGHWYIFGSALLARSEPKEGDD